MRHKKETKKKQFSTLPPMTSQSKFKYMRVNPHCSPAKISLFAWKTATKSSRWKFLFFLKDEININLNIVDKIFHPPPPLKNRWPRMSLFSIIQLIKLERYALLLLPCLRLCHSNPTLTVIKKRKRKNQINHPQMVGLCSFLYWKNPLCKIWEKFFASSPLEKGCQREKGFRYEW